MNDEQIAEISSAPVELSGSDMDRLLIEDYKLTEFQLLVAKSHMVGLQPYTARNFLIYSHTFDRIKHDFCKEDGVLPVGEVGEYIIIAISDPFNLKTTNRIQEMTHMNVVALVALEREKWSILTRIRIKTNPWVSETSWKRWEWSSISRRGESMRSLPL